MFVYTKNSIHKLSSSPGDYPDPGKDVKEVRKLVATAILHEQER